MGKLTVPPLRSLLALFNLRLGVWLPNPANANIVKQVKQGELHSRPRAMRLIREFIGRNKIKSRFIYVSDGGHYENLGMVELLRRRCTEIWCVDASGDPPGSTATLTEAMRLAEAELGVRWHNEGELKQFAFKDDDQRPEDPGYQLLGSTAAKVEYSLDYPDEPGVLYVIKVGLATESPEHLHDYQRRDPAFPYDPTGNQLFRADRFDAY